MNLADQRMIRLIALFKLLKAILLIGVAVGALKLLHGDVSNILQESVARMGLGPGSRYVGRVILKATTLTPNRIKDLAVGSFIYAGLFFIEGIGLWLLKRWAEWFTVIITSSLVPVEAYEIYHRPTAIRILVLMINIAVAGFLVYRIRTGHSDIGQAKIFPHSSIEERKALG